MRFTLPLALISVFALTGCPVSGDSSSAPAPSNEQPAPSTPPPAAPPPAASSLGSFSEGGVTLEVKAIVPVWSAEKSELTLVALPFEPSPEEVERIQKDEVFFMLMDHKETLPGFPDRLPYAHVALSWPFDKADVGKGEKASVHVFINNLKQKGSNMNVNRGNGEGVTLSGELAAGSSVQVRAQGKGDIMGTALEWELNFSGELLGALKK